MMVLLSIVLGRGTGASDGFVVTWRRVMSSIRIEAGGLRRKIIYYLQNKESQNYNYITIDKSMCKRNYIC